MKPIKPSDVDKSVASIPSSIIGCVNEMIKTKWDGRQAKILQKDLLKEVLKKDRKLTSQGIFDKHLFDFEPLFKKAGWLVDYDKPAYNEDYEAYFVFRKKTK